MSETGSDSGPSVGEVGSAAVWTEEERRRASAEHRTEEDGRWNEPTSLRRRHEPPVTETSAPFWDATREGRLVLQWCTSCEQPVWYPREVCPGCLGTDLEWRPAGGQGVVYACTVEHTAQTKALEAPYVVALVELDEGVRLLSNVVGCPPEQVAVGDRVRVTWEPLSDGRQLPLFEPEPEQEPE